MEKQTGNKIEDANVRTSSMLHRLRFNFASFLLLLLIVSAAFQPISGLSLSRAFMDPENALFPETNSQKISELDSVERNQQQQQQQAEENTESEASQGCAVYDNDPIHGEWAMA